jgi:hypothetical protein
VAEARITDDHDKLYACSTGTFALGRNLNPEKAASPSSVLDEGSSQ